MKKILTLLVLVSSLFALSACQSAFSNTKVRVVGLTYSTSAEELASVPSNNTMRLLSNKLLADEVEEYIFPGDILTFTVELEDPNFEFISLLSIKFNDQIIRANVDNSIVTTRDCGANICVDFPFEINADKSDYSVQEVKFAKLNSDNGVNAIIDNQSTKTVVINVYTDEIFPYVVESVLTLNNALKDMLFFNDNDFLSTEEVAMIGRNRSFMIVNFPASIQPFVNLIVSTRSYFSNNLGNDIDFNKIDYDYVNYFTTEYDYAQQDAQRIELWHYGYYYGPETPNNYPTILLVHYIENRYREIFFFNIGNKIYVDILGNEYFVIEMINDMRIINFY